MNGLHRESSITTFADFASCSLAFTAANRAPPSCTPLYSRAERNWYTWSRPGYLKIGPANLFEGFGPVSEIQLSKQITTVCSRSWQSRAKLLRLRKPHSICGKTHKVGDLFSIIENVFHTTHRHNIHTADARAGCVPFGSRAKCLDLPTNHRERSARPEKNHLFSARWLREGFDSSATTAKGFELDDRPPSVKRKTGVKRSTFL